MVAGLPCLVYTTGTEDAFTKGRFYGELRQGAVPTHAKWWVRSLNYGLQVHADPPVQGSLQCSLSARDSLLSKNPPPKRKTQSVQIKRFQVKRKLKESYINGEKGNNKALSGR